MRNVPEHAFDSVTGITAVYNFACSTLRRRVSLFR